MGSDALPPPEYVLCPLPDRPMHHARILSQHSTASSAIAHCTCVHKAYIYKTHIMNGGFRCGNTEDDGPDEPSVERASHSNVRWGA